MKEGFILYWRFYDSIKHLSFEDKGKLFDAIYKYHIEGVLPKGNEGWAMAFSFFKVQFDLDNAKYQRVCERNRQNGEKGGRPPQRDNPEEPKKPTGISGNPEEPKKPTGISGNPEEPKKPDKEKEKEERERKEKEIGERRLTPYDEIVSLFNSICFLYSKVKAISDSRKEKIRLRFKEMDYSIDTLRTVFSKMQASDFLKGGNDRKWKATFDWIMENDKNWVKVLEGNFDNKETPAKKEAPVYDPETFKW